MQDDRPEERAISDWMADWVIDFLAPCYGPRGLSKLIDLGDGDGRIQKGASALRDAGILHPDLQPYVELASAVQEHAGDQATGAVLLAARLVRSAHQGVANGVPVAAYLDGYPLALRQCRAELAAMAVPDPDGKSLASVADADLAALVLEGVRGLAKDGAVRLDAVDVRTESRGPDWLPGVLVEPNHKAKSPRDGGILLLTAGWKAGPWRQDFAYKMTAAHHVTSWTDMEDELRAKARDHVLGLGVAFVACTQEVDPHVAEELARHGVTVWNDAPLSAVERLEKATGAKPVPKLMLASKADVGAGRLHRDRRHGYITGEGPSSTLVLPSESAPSKEATKDVGERLLRAAGSHLQDPVAVPGGGRWQRRLAKSLRSAADAAPGKAPWAVRDAAKALDGLADDLVRNHGLQPLDHRLLPGADDVLDVARSVRIAVVGAFEMAIQVLRIDARLRKRESEGGWLRGADKASLVEGGDVPPLM